MIRELEIKFTPYAMNKVKQDFHIASNYNVDIVKANKQWYIESFSKSLKFIRHVTRKGYKHVITNINGLLNCDCGDDIFHGTPCRHELAIAIKTKSFLVKLLPFKERWMKEYFVDEGNWKEPDSLPLKFPNKVIFFFG